MQGRLDGAVVMLLTWVPFSLGRAVNTGAEARDLASPYLLLPEVTERAGPGSGIRPWRSDPGVARALWVI